MTPSLSLEQTLVAELTDEQRTEIAALLTTYRELKIDADLLEAQLEEENKKIFVILQGAGIEKTVIDGVPCTIVGGNTSKLDKAAFVLLGGDLKMLDDATTSKPKKKYLKITLGKEKEAA